MRALFAKLARDVPAMLGLAIVLFVLLLAVFGPWLAPFPGDASASHLLRRLKPPSADFPFGTDNLGRDIFSRVILGARGALATTAPDGAYADCASASTWERLQIPPRARE